MYPPLLPCHDGPAAAALPLYPPVTHDPPAVMKSVNGPPAMLISSVPPSHPPSVWKKFWNVNWFPADTPNAGDVMTLSEDVLTSFTNAAFGALAGEMLVVCHGLLVPPRVAVVHPAGRAGAPTPSKFCDSGGSKPPGV